MSVKLRNPQVSFVLREGGLPVAYRAMFIEYLFLPRAGVVHAVARSIVVQLQSRAAQPLAYLFANVIAEDSPENP